MIWPLVNRPELLVPLPNTATETPKTSLEGLLNEMLHYGRPRLMNLSDGWSCTIEMNTSSKGAEFTIRSDYNLKTPTLAAQQCFDRILSTINQGKP